MASHLLKQIAYQLGFDLVAVSSADPAEEDRARYKDWIEKGYAGELHYMVREAPKRWEPRDLLPEARSVVTFGVNFFSGEKNVEPRYGYGRVARYAWGKDYHLVVKARLEEWIAGVRSELGREIKYKILVDSSPLLERAFAYRGGLGFIGKNTLLISRTIGSFFFLCEVLIDLECVPDVWNETKSGDACGSCRECIADCPTGALVAPRQLDARKCISYWTIENKGGILEEMRSLIGDWIFGCDVCQDVCPYNGLSRPTRWKELTAEYGAGPFLSLIEVLGIRDEAGFRRRFEGTPILRAKKAGLLRNACVVAGNQKFKEARGILERLASEDPQDWVRSHAAWALNQIG